MTAYRGNGHVARQDTLDTLFEWAERAFCSSTPKKFGRDPDTLDYVFEKVESFTCRQEAKEPGVSYDNISIRRDNSLVEHETYGKPVGQRRAKATIKPLGKRGDVIDYVFENVESYACNESMPDDRQSMTVIAACAHDDFGDTKSRRQNVYEPEDEIQLYFRPSRSRRKHTKGEF